MSIENTIALIIPIHPPKFQFIYKLKKKISTINKCCDIILIFSKNSEYERFICKDIFKSIILPSNYQTNNIITFKKFYALNELKEKYSYYIVCDSEIDIIDVNFTHENILMKINEFYSNKKIFSGEVLSKQTGAQKITKSSSKVFKNRDDNNKLKNLTKNYRLYYWWSDLPVYKGSHLDDFFSKINDINFGRNHFDHKIYLNYLVLYHNFEFINITPLIGRNFGLESYNDNNINNLEILKAHSYTFSWIVPNLFKKHKKYLKKNGSFLLYHLDRI